MKTLVLDVPGWPGHRAGQHVDVRLTPRTATRPAQLLDRVGARGRDVELTVERLDDGEVSPYLSDVLRAGDRLEVRGPIGGYFVWDAAEGGPLLLVGGGSGIVPLMAMLRHRAASGSDAPVRLLASWRTHGRRDLPRGARRLGELAVVEIVHTLTRATPAAGPGIAGGSIGRCSPRSPGRRERRADLRVRADGPRRGGRVGTGRARPRARRIRTERFGPTGG